MDPFGFENFDPSGSNKPVQKGLGFATPGADPAPSLLNYKSDNEESKTVTNRHENILSQMEQHSQSQIALIHVPHGPSATVSNTQSHGRQQFLLGQSQLGAA